MSLDVFKEKLLEYSKKYNIEPPQVVLDSIKFAAQTSYSKNFVLILSEKSLNDRTCQVLSECLHHDNSFEEIILNDCMLMPDCLQLILEGLADNSFCRKLSLKGNNIKNSGCEKLANFLKQNNSLINLSAEWNQLGIAGTGFEQFCYSLTINKCLRILDLRNNQIGYDNCKILSQTLKKNDSLQELDIRYNTLGLSGGKELLKIFDSNHTLSKLQTLGNNIPTEVMNQIENLAERNAAIVNSKKNTEKQKITDKTIKSFQNNDDCLRKQTEDLLDKIDKQDVVLRISEKKRIAKIVQLEKLLDEKRSKCHELASRLSLSESKVELYQSQIKEFENQFQKANYDRENFERQYRLQLDKEKDFRLEMETRFLKEQSHSQERILQLQNHISDIEAELKCQKENVFQMKENVTITNAECKKKEIESEEKISKLKDQHQKELNTLNSKKENEIFRLRQDNETSDNNWRDKLLKSDDKCKELENEILQLKSDMNSKKIAFEESFHELKQKCKTDEEQKLKRLEDQIKTVNSIREELDTQCGRQLKEIDVLQKENAKYRIEIESSKIKKDNLEEELSRKNSQMLSEVEKVRLEWMHRVQKLESERENQADLFCKIEHQDKQIQDLKNSHRDEVSMKNAEINSLRDKLKSQEIQINRMQEDEKRRTGALQSAILQYCQPTLHFVSSSCDDGNH